MAITDLNNLFGAIKFYKEGRAKGVKPIIGAEVMVEGLGADASVSQRLILLVLSHAGYLNLCELLAQGWTSHVVREQSVLKWAWIEQRHEGLILLTGAQSGSLGQTLLQGDLDRAREIALKMAATFPHRCYIELQRAGRNDDEAHVQAAVQLAASLHLPVVATHPVQFTSPNDYEAHEARVCISEGEILANPRRQRKFTREQYFKSSAQMAELFADVPSALRNSVAIAQRCNLTLTLGKPQLPDYPTPEVDGRRLSIEAYFRQIGRAHV